MSEKPAWKKEYEASVKSLKNERKAQFTPKPCSECNKDFRPESAFAKFCSKCKAKFRRYA